MRGPPEVVSVCVREWEEGRERPPPLSSSAKGRLLQPLPRTQSRCPETLLPSSPHQVVYSPRFLAGAMEVGG